MPKGKTAATVETREPDDAYDHLTQKDKDAWDQIGSLGYVPEQGSSGLWLARHRVQTTITVGPCQTLDVLLGRLQDEIADDVAPGPDPDEESEAEFDNQIDDPDEENPDAKPAKPKVHKLTKLPNGSTLQDVAVWSEIKGLGYSAEKDEDGLWAAYQLEGEDEIGPAESISDLRDMITNQLIDHTEITIEVDPATDAPFLDGMAPTVNKQLANAIIAQHKAKMARVEATAEETKHNKNMAVVGTLHKRLYQPDPSQPGSKIFRVGKITSRLIHTEEEKFVTEKATSGMDGD